MARAMAKAALMSMKYDIVIVGLQQKYRKSQKTEFYCCKTNKDPLLAAKQLV